jgi:competence protein ComEA
MRNTIVGSSIGLLIGLLAAGLILLVAGPPKGQPVSVLPTARPDNLTIAVIGAVNHPGIVEIPSGGRVSDVIEAAGGLTAEADQNDLNLAALVVDGQKINVRSMEEAATIPTESSRSSAVEIPGLININTATAEELDSLPGIGPAKAAQIIEYRQNHGPFVTIEDVLKVTGIGPAIFEDIAPLISVAGVP